MYVKIETSPPPKSIDQNKILFNLKAVIDSFRPYGRIETCRFNEMAVVLTI